MKLHHKPALSLLLALGATSLISWDTPSTEFAASPKIGVRVQRDISTHFLLVAETMKTSRNGEESISQRALDLDSTQTLSVVDEVKEKVGKMPTLFRRDYISSKFEVDTTRSMGGQQTKDQHFDGKGSIRGKGVMFTWLPEDKEFGRYFDKEEGIEEVLPGLTADLTMGSLLPPGPVKAGGTWDLAPGVLVDLFANGGDTDFGLKNNAGYPMLRTMRLGMGLNIEQAFGGEEEGTVEAFLMGTETVDGRDLALIQLTFDVKLSKDQKELAQTGMTINELASGFMVQSALVKVELSGSGTLRWDIDGGYLHDTQDLRAAKRVSTTLVQSIKRADGKEDLSTQEMVLVGSMTHSVICKPVQ